MKLEKRIAALDALGSHLKAGNPAWENAIRQARAANAWFHPQFVQSAADRIREQFLDAARLEAWCHGYSIKADPEQQKTVGIVMAGNIPMVGMHDLICTFMAGHRQLIKPSEKDSVLMQYVIGCLHAANPESETLVVTAERLKHCDAYIATGSDNAARYFEQYFASVPHIIRRNRTSVAVLDGTETKNELDLLADDICMYFGLGCRNVTQVWVPEGYDFVPLLDALRKYDWIRDEHKYRHNLDYNLTIQILNGKFYMTNDSTLLTEDPSPFSPIGQLHYMYLREGDKIADKLDIGKIQCVVGHGHLDFGSAQVPGLAQYADGVDTMAFLREI